VLDVIREPRLNHRVIVEGGLLAPECGGLLTRFFERRRREAAARSEPPA
jgi:tRNA(adenine34) deaminase